MWLPSYLLLPTSCSHMRMCSHMHPCRPVGVSHAMATASPDPGDGCRSVIRCRMGLGHVFSGGCSEINDGVTDTAQMSGPNCEQHPAALWQSLHRCCQSQPHAADLAYTPAPATCIARHRHAKRGFAVLVQTTATPGGPRSPTRAPIAPAASRTPTPSTSESMVMSDRHSAAAHVSCCLRFYLHFALSVQSVHAYNLEGAPCYGHL